MALSHTSILYIVDLVFYIILFPVTLYLAYRHGRHAILGYFYLNVCCAVRIVADIVSVVDASHTSANGQPSIASAVLGSIGLSPLMLSLAGFLHEIHHYLLIVTSTSNKTEKRAKRWMWFAQIQIHGIVAAGMVLLIIGTVNLFSATSNKDLQNDDKLRSAGAVILLVLHLGMIQYAGWLLYRCIQMSGRLSRSVLTLAKWTIVAGLVILVKVAYAVAYTFDHKDTSLNPVTGSFVVKVLLVVVVFLVAVIVLVVGGWMSKDITSKASFRPARDSESGYESYRVVNMQKGGE